MIKTLLLATFLLLPLTANAIIPMVNAKALMYNVGDTVATDPAITPTNGQHALELSLRDENHISVISGRNVLVHLLNVTDTQLDQICIVIKHAVKQYDDIGSVMLHSVETDKRMYCIP